MEKDEFRRKYLYVRRGVERDRNEADMTNKGAASAAPHVP
jgi:hypothetical protein